MDGNNKISIKILEVHYRKEVIVAAGLGNSPNKWVNNRMESLNLVIKEQINNNAVDMVTFLEAVKKKVFDQQLEKLVKGIFGMGEYQLSSYQVDPVRWVSMTTDQRKALVEKVMCINIKDFERTPYDNTTLNLSISLKECVVINVLPLGTFEGLWERTKFLISNRSAIQLINGDFCVTDTEKAFNVKERKSPKLTYTCDCTKFQQLDGICSHVMAVAERKELVLCSRILSRARSQY